jgi:arabinogalactan endo-1,4-beta-galactosidase
MATFMRTIRIVHCLGFVGLISACSGTSDSGTPGSSGTGGTTSGAFGTGGTAPVGGGTSSMIGSAALGGSFGLGGAMTSGGVATSGGASGSVTTEGTVSTGGTNSRGGAENLGGSIAKAGSSNTGGVTAKGGTSSTGGVTAKGGTSSTGGVTAKGGTSSTGGSNAGHARFWIGADVTDQEVAAEATRATLLTILKSHGFNAIRLRTFVDPKASDGYDKTNGYDDIAHTVAFGKQIKDAGMALLIDFHYSDNWADPGKQCVPVAWQNYTTIAELATALHDYTKDAITKLIAGGARPDMVQIGNETTPGMLIHRCDSGGQPTGNNPITGSTSNWNNLGALLKAGVQGVKDVDTGILISFHIDRGNSYSVTKNWIDNVVKQGIPFDAFGESCYQKYQGDPNSTANTKNGWSTTFSQLSTAYPNVKFFAAEYGPMQREINDVIYGMPNGQGIGTFNWEPTTQGDWNSGHDLLRRSGTTYNAQPDLALYDQMKIDYASRL